MMFDFYWLLNFEYKTSCMPKVFNKENKKVYIKRIKILK